jgi:putative transposase
MLWVKRKYPGLSAQSAQQIVTEFCEAVWSARQLRKNGHGDASYPWRLPKYHNVTYTNQDARVRAGTLLLPNGKSGTLSVRIPATVTLPGKMMEVHVAFGRIRIVCKISDGARHAVGVIGVDLGVNTLIAAGDDKNAVLVSGREAKATVQWRAKKLASISEAQSSRVKGSRRWRRLQRRKYRMLDKSQFRIRDIIHKATRIVADTFPNASAIVGKPFNDAARKMAGKQAQQVSSACNAKIIRLLDYKCSGAVEVPEPYTSQTCPVCGERRRCGRVFRCECGFVAPRDVVGFTNIRRIGLHGKMTFSPVIVDISFVRPIRKYPVATRVVPAEPRHVART